MTPFLVWLTIVIAWPDVEPWIVEVKQPNLTTCMVQASHVLEQAATVRSQDPYRVSAKCTMEWPGHNPA